MGVPKDLCGNVSISRSLDKRKARTIFLKRSGEAHVEQRVDPIEKDSRKPAMEVVGITKSLDATSQCNVLCIVLRKYSSRPKRWRRWMWTERVPKHGTPWDIQKMTG